MSTQRLEPTSTEAPARVRSWRPYFRKSHSNLLLSLAVLLAAGLATAVHHVVGLYPVAFLGAMGWYAFASYRLSASGASDTDLVVVSEQIIACGIASLIGHIALAVSSTSFVLLGGDALSMSEIQVAAYIFAEGLGCAAIAPILAMILRSASITTQDDVQAAAMAATADALKEFVRKSTSLSRNMDRLANAMDQSVHRYAEAADSVVVSLRKLEKDIETQSHSVGVHLAELDAKVRSLGDGVARTTAELRRSATDSSAFFTATDEAARNLGQSVDALSQRLQTSSDLLVGLESLISSVSDFVRPPVNQNNATAD